MESFTLKDYKRSLVKTYQLTNFYLCDVELYKGTYIVSFLSFWKKNSKSDIFFWTLCGNIWPSEKVIPSWYHRMQTDKWWNDNGRSKVNTSFLNMTFNSNNWHHYFTFKVAIIENDHLDVKGALTFAPSQAETND